MKLGSRVKELCRERGISVAKIERLAGIPEKSISKWDTNIPSFDKVERVVDAFGISFDEFMENGMVHIELDFPRSWYNTIKAAANICNESTNDFIKRTVLNASLSFVDAEDAKEINQKDLSGQSNNPPQTAVITSTSFIQTLRDKLS